MKGNFSHILNFLSCVLCTRVVDDGCLALQSPDFGSSATESLRPGRYT